MTTPVPPRLTGDPAQDTLVLEKFMSDFYKSLVVEDQLPQTRARIAAIDVSAISLAGADAKLVSRLPKQLSAFSSPPTAAQMEGLRQLANAGLAVMLRIVQAAQVQG